MEVNNELIGKYQEFMEEKIRNMSEEELHKFEEEKRINGILEEETKLNELFEYLIIENKRYREALEFYADKKNYQSKPNGVSSVDFDEGIRAIVSLNREEDFMSSKNLVQGTNAEGLLSVMEKNIERKELKHKEQQQAHLIGHVSYIMNHPYAKTFEKDTTLDRIDRALKQYHEDNK